MNPMISLIHLLTYLLIYHLTDLRWIKLNFVKILLTHEKPMNLHYWIRHLPAREGKKETERENLKRRQRKRETGREMSERSEKILF